MLNIDNFILFCLILMRITGFIAFNPILGRKNIPAYVKSGLIMVLTYIFYTSANANEIIISSNIEFAVLLLKELFVGYVIGFVINLFLYVLIFAGDIMDMQMGISMSKIFDPQSNASLSLTTTYFNALFMIMFFTLDGHLTLIKILMKYQEILPYGSIVISKDVYSAVIDVFFQCTVLAVKLAFPLIAIEFMVEISTGILMKTIPQINVFVVSIQAKVLIGLLILIVIFSPIASYLQNLSITMFKTIEDVLTLLK